MGTLFMVNRPITSDADFDTLIEDIKEVLNRTIEAKKYFNKMRRYLAFELPEDVIECSIPYFPRG